MAILNKIRQRSLFLILIIAMALFSFVLADLFKNSDGFSSKAQNVIASINGEDIKRDDFINKVEAMQRQFGGSMTSTQAMNRVWDQELDAAVLNEQYDALGISVQRDQMRDLLKLGLQSFEEFKNEDGLYDENKLNAFIANLREISPNTSLLGGSPINYEAWTNYENNIAVAGLQQTYYNLIKAGVSGTLAEGALAYKLENDRVDIKYVQIPFASIADSLIEVTSSDISKYVNDNKERYEVEESRDIYFVQFSEEASLEDENAIQNELNELLQGREDNPSTATVDETELGFKDTEDHEGFLSVNSSIGFVDRFVFKEGLTQSVADSIWALGKGETFGPYKDAGMYKITKVVDVRQQHDSIKSRHILIPFVGALQAAPTVTQTEEEAKATADSILSVLRRDKSKFGDLVTELSSDIGSRANGGEYDYHEEGYMVPEFSDYEASARIGQLGVVKTDFGFHIIEVLDRKNKRKAVKVGHLAKEIEPSAATADNVFNETSKFEIAIAERPFMDVATENNYSVMPVSSIKALDESIPGLGNQRTIVRWAFEDGVGVGDSKRFNLASGGYAVVIVTAVNEEGVMSTEKASVTALPTIRKQKKAEMIKAQLAGNTIEDIAASQGQTVQTALAINMQSPTISGVGNEPLVVGTAFGLAEGATSKPIIGEQGVYIVQVTKINPGAGLPNYSANANRLGNTRSGLVTTDVLNALKKAADIEDNRAIFY